MIVFVLCLIGGLQIYHENQIREVKTAANIVCKTGNTLRQQLNARGKVQRDFFQTAAETRGASAKLAFAKGDKKQGDIDAKASREYHNAVKAFVSIPLIDCAASYRAGRTIYER